MEEEEDAFQDFSRNPRAAWMSVYYLRTRSDGHWGPRTPLPTTATAGGLPNDSERLRAAIRACSMFASLVVHQLTFFPMLSSSSRPHDDASLSFSPSPAYGLLIKRAEDYSR